MVTQKNGATYTPVSYTHLDVYKRQTDDYGMACQQASVCLLVSFLSAVVRGYGLYPGTLPDRLYRGFRIGFRHLYPCL